MGGRVWSEQDDARLAFWWGTVSIETIAERLGRTTKAVYQRGKRRGLARRGVMVSVSAMAREAGVDPSTLRRICRLAQIPMKPAPRDPNDPRTKGRHVHRLVDRAEATMAVEDYVKGETVTAAARRRGRPDNWLRLRLRAAGVYVDAYAHRYPTEVIDDAIASFRGRALRVIEARGKTLTVREWAAETGVPIKTIQDRLRRGVLPEQAVAA